MTRTDQVTPEHAGYPEQLSTSAAPPPGSAVLTGPVGGVPFEAVAGPGVAAVPAGRPGWVDQLRDGLADGIEVWLEDEDLMKALRAVPRHPHVPQLFLPLPDGRWQPVGPHDPAYWPLVYADTDLTVEVDGAPPQPGTGPVTGTATAATLAPGKVAALINALNVDCNNDHVLHITARTGYTAAVLREYTHRSVVLETNGGEAVDRLRRALDVAPHELVISAGGASFLAGGYGSRTFAGVLSTQAVTRIPQRWIQLVEPDGTLVTGLWRDLQVGAVAQLAVDGHGIASGLLLPAPIHLPPAAAVTPLHLAPTPGNTPPSAGVVPSATVTAAVAAALREVIAARAGQYDNQWRDTATMMDADDLHDASFGLWAAARLPGVTRVPDHLLSDTTAGGEAATTATNGGPGELDRTCALIGEDGSWVWAEPGRLVQGGPRRLWTELESIYPQWDRDRGSSRLGLTVTPTGKHVFWVEDPAEVLWIDEPAQLWNSDSYAGRCKKTWCNRPSCRTRR